MSAPPPQGGDTRPLASLTVDEVCRLLHSIELGKAAEKFRGSEFNGESLALATDGDLLELGVTPGANRKKLLARVAEWVANGVPAKAIGCCPKPRCPFLAAPTPPSPLHVI